MTYPNHTGTFVPNLPPSENCVLLQPIYGPTSLVLTAIHLPVEVGSLMLLPNKLGLTWAAAPAYPGTTYDVLRGDLATLPVGPGVGETCLTPPGGITATSTTDSATPTPNHGFWYLTRERITTCGIGTYGFATSGTERLSTGCP